MSMEISVRDSISAISEIQEHLQTDTLESFSTGVRSKRDFLVIFLLPLMTVETSALAQISHVCSSRSGLTT